MFEDGLDGFVVLLYLGVTCGFGAATVVGVGTLDLAGCLCGGD